MEKNVDQNQSIPEYKDLDCFIIFSKVSFQFHKLVTSSKTQQLDSLTKIVNFLPNRWA